MKIALLVALVATVAAVSSYTPTPHSAVFKPGEEYVYHYKGQVLSGIPKSSSQFAGLLIDSLIVLQFQQDYKVVMKMEKIKLFKINNKISTLPSELLNESELTHLTGEQATVISEQLIKPLKFRYEEGEVRDLEKESTDRYWSVNIKKGVLSLFQVTLKEKYSQNLSSDSTFYSDPTMTRVKSYGSRGAFSPMTPYWKLKTNSVYKVMETDVTGNCETKYTVISDKEHISTSTSKMHVTSVRNFDNCITRPFYIQGLFQGVYRYPTEKDILQPTVHTDYVITGDRTHFLIKEVTLRGKYFFLVNGLEGGDMSSYIVQHMTLKKTEPIRSPVRLLTPKIDVHGLLMVIPKSTMLPGKKTYEEMLEEKSSVYGQKRSYREEYPTLKREYEKEMNDEEEEEKLFSTGEKGGNIVSVVEQKLSELVQCLYPVSERKCSEFLLEISQILRQMNREELKTLMTRYVRAELSGSSETEYRKAEILLDVLPTLPSPDAAKVLLELIRERKISETRATVLVKVMSLLVKPTPMIIKNTLELYKELPKERSNALNSKNLLHQSLLLSVGTLTHRLINVMRSQGKPIPEVITFVDSISGDLRRMLEESTSESQKILILKSIGNMGASETIPTLKNTVEDVRQPIKIRVNAVFALRRLAKQFNKQVSPILLSIFMDVKEVRELRQAAFIVIINANPSYTTLQMIAHRIRHEPSSQIRSLVYSSLVNLASFTSHEPEHKTLVKNARLVLKTIEPVRVGVHDTMSLFINKFSEKYDLGGALNVMKIKSQKSALPEAIVANLQGTLFGKHRSLLEVGAEGKSFELLLRKVFGPHGLLKEILKGQVSLSDVLKPLTRTDMGGVEHKIREILNKMMGELRTGEEEPFSQWYVHLLGNELQYIVLNSQNVEELVNKVTTFIPEMLMKLTRGVKVDVIKSLSNIASITLASPLGIPLSLNFTTMAILKVDGHVKINNMPTWSEMRNFRHAGQLPKLSLDIDLKPHIDVTQRVILGADMRWLKSAVGGVVNVRANQPVKLSVHLDAPEHLISVKYFIPKETIKTLHVTAKPVTLIKFVPITAHKLPYLSEEKEIKGEHIVKVTPFEHKYECSLTGLEIESRGQYSLCGPNWCPIMPLFGKQELTVVARPMKSVEFVHLKIKSLKSNVEFEGVPASRLTEEFYQKDEEELEQERSFYSGRNYRTSSRSMIESGEFEPVTTDSVFKSEPIKRQLLITLGPNNLQSPKIKSLITWLMSREYLENQLNVQIIRLAHGETPAWKVLLNHVANLKVLHPEQLRTYTGEFVTKTHLLWDIYGNVNEVKAKIISGSPFDFTRELKEHSFLTTDNLPEANAQKVKLTLEMEFPQMTHKMLKYITIVHDLIKYQSYNKLTTSIPLNSHPNKITVAVELLPWWEKMNVIVKTPREDSYISSIPFYWNPFQTTSEKIRLHDVPAWNWYESRTESEYLTKNVPYTTSPITSTECSISPRRITTFDGVTLPLSAVTKFWQKGCSMVLAQHCTDDSLFSVSGVGHEENWEFKILMPRFDVKLLSKNRRLVVIVNGEEKTLHVSQPIVVRKEFDEMSPKMYTIEKIDQGFIELKAYELGITLTVNSESLQTEIKISPVSMLQGQLCGLCGNFNQDQSDDYNVPTDFRPESRDFYHIIKKSIISSETCDVERLRNTRDDYCEKESHLKIHRYESGTEMTCESEKKVLQCAEGCRPAQMDSIKTCFTCRPKDSGITLPRKTYIPSKWETEERGGVDCEDFFQRVEVPTRCVPVY